MKSPLCAFYNAAAVQNVLGVDKAANYFLRNSLQGTADLLLI
jgi:hypothetical protein